MTPTKPTIRKRPPRSWDICRDLPWTFLDGEERRIFGTWQEAVNHLNALIELAKMERK